MLLSIGTTQTLYMSIGTFLPLYCKTAHEALLDYRMGLIICMFELAYILSSPVIGASLEKVGRKNYISIGYIIITIGTLGFGVIS